MWRGYRRKIFEKEKELIKQLRKKGFTLKEIEYKLGVTADTIRYWLDPNERKRKKLCAAAYYRRHKNNTEFKRKRQEYLKGYIRERYRRDPEFHERMDQFHANYMRRLKEGKFL